MTDTNKLFDNLILKCCDDFTIEIEQIAGGGVPAPPPPGETPETTPEITSTTITFNCYFFMYYLYKKYECKGNIEFKKENKVDTSYESFYEKVEKININRIEDIKTIEDIKDINNVCSDYNNINEQTIKRLVYIYKRLIKEIFGETIHGIDKNNNLPLIEEIVKTIKEKVENNENNENLKKFKEIIEKCIEKKNEEEEVKLKQKDEELKKKQEEELKKKQEEELKKNAEFITLVNNFFNNYKNNKDNFNKIYEAKKAVLDKSNISINTNDIPKHNNDIDIINNKEEIQKFIDTYETILGVSKVIVKGRKYIKSKDKTDIPFIQQESNCVNIDNSKYGSFDAVYIPSDGNEPNYNNEIIYENNIKPLINNMIASSNNLIFISIGGSGSGKTWTLCGDTENLMKGQKMLEDGICQRIINGLTNNEISYKAFQIYNGELYKVDNTDEINIYKINGSDSQEKFYNDLNGIRTFKLFKTEKTNIDEIIDEFITYLDNNKTEYDNIFDFNNLKKKYESIVYKSIDTLSILKKIFVNSIAEKLKYDIAFDDNDNKNIEKLKNNLKKDIKQIEYIKKLLEFFFVSLCEFDNEWLNENKINNFNDLKSSKINNNFNEILKSILRNRLTRGTFANPDSSRSHLFIQFIIDNGPSFTIVDAAGLEKPYEYIGEASFEGYYIIDSLYQLQKIMDKYKNFDLNYINNPFQLKKIEDQPYLIPYKLNKQDRLDNNLDYPCPYKKWKDKNIKYNISLDPIRSDINNNIDRTNIIKAMYDTMKYILNIKDSVDKYTKVVTFVNTKTFIGNNDNENTVVETTKDTLKYGQDLLEQSRQGCDGNPQSGYGKKKLIFKKKKSKKKSLKKKSKKRSVRKHLKKKSKKRSKKRSLKKKLKKRSLKKR